MVKRYNPNNTAFGPPMYESPEGRYAGYDDYAALEDVLKTVHEDLVALEAECARLRQELSKRPLGVDEDPLTGRLR